MRHAALSEKHYPLYPYFLALALASTAQGQFTGFGSKSAGSKQQSDDQKASKLLHEKLPLVLDANTAYPTVPDEDLLGGPFHGRVLAITLETLAKPLPPGDYVVPTTFFCSEYSIHRGGEGVAYTLGPAQGTSAKAISTLLWRGMLTGHSPQELQSVSWAIQGSVPYDKMPPKYKALVDQLIPEMKNQVNGQAFADIEDGFQGKVNRVTKKLSEGISKGTGGFVHADIKVDAELNGSFARLGRLGQMALDGESVSNIVTASFPNDQAREQALYAGQGQQAPPIPPMNGPWSVMVPGVAYMRFAVHGGNLKGDNVMQIRVLRPQTVARSAFTEKPRLELAGYLVPKAPSTSASSLLGMFGGKFDDAAFAKCVANAQGLGSLGVCEALATTANGMIGYGINAAVQAPSIVVTVPPSGVSQPLQPQDTRKTANVCVKKLIYEPLYNKNTMGDKDDILGVCIYLGANTDCTSPDAVAVKEFPQYNWVQTYQTNFDHRENPQDEAACPVNQPHTDPCPSKPGEGPLYRADDRAFEGPGALVWEQKYSIDHIFRDLPRRSLQDLKRNFPGTAFYFSTAPLNDTTSNVDSNLRFVGVPSLDEPGVYQSIIKISYGFSVSADQRRYILKPLIINGKMVSPGQTFATDDLIRRYKLRPPPEACTVRPKYLDVLAPHPQ